MDANFLELLGIFLLHRVIIIDLFLMQFNELVSCLLPVYRYPLIVKECIFEVNLSILALSDATSASLDNFDILDDSEQVFDDIFGYQVSEYLWLVADFLNNRGLLKIWTHTHHIERKPALLVLKFPQFQKFVDLGLELVRQFLEICNNKYSVIDLLELSGKVGLLRLDQSNLLFIKEGSHYEGFNIRLGSILITEQDVVVLGHGAWCCKYDEQCFN